MIIQKDVLNLFLDTMNLHLVWFINASKEIRRKDNSITKFNNWTGLQEYTGDSVQGVYYIDVFRDR